MAVEIYTEKLINIKEGAYFKTLLADNSGEMAGSQGLDRFGFHSVITSEKRVAGLGREFIYTLESFPAGMGAIEARPGEYIDISCEPLEISLELETNLILDPGTLRDTLGIRLVNTQGKSTDIPLSRPDVKVWWQGRGRYSIPVGSLLQSRILQAVS